MENRMYMYIYIYIYASKAVQTQVKKYLRGLKCHEPVQNDRNSSARALKLPLQSTRKYKQKTMLSNPTVTANMRMFACKDE